MSYSINESLFEHTIYTSIRNKSWEKLSKIFDYHLEPGQESIEESNIDSQISILEDRANILKAKRDEYNIQMLNFWVKFNQKKRKYTHDKPFQIFGEAKLYVSEKEAVTALTAAAETGQYELVEFLLKNCPQEQLKAILTNKTSTGLTALHLAAKEGHLSVVALLCEYYKENNISIDTLDDDNQSALSYATAREHWSVTELLIAQGADYKAVNKLTTKEMANIVLNAADKGQNEKLNFFASQCSDEIRKSLFTNAVDLEGNTVLHLAAKNGDKETVAYLCRQYISLGISIDVRNRAEQTPLHIAIRNHKAEAEGILTTNGANKELKDALDEDAEANKSSRITIKPTKSTVPGSKKVETVQDRYNDAKARVTDYHSPLQCSARRIKMRIAELGAEASKATCFTSATKRKKMFYLNELLTAFEKASADQKEKTPAEIINAYKASNPEKYGVILGGTWSKVSATLMESIIGPATAQGEDHDHKYLIERDAAYRVSRQLREQYTRALNLPNADKEKLNRIILALDTLGDKIKDRGLFNKSIAVLVDEFKKTNIGGSNKWLEADNDSKQFLDLLLTLNQKCEVPTRNSMDVSQTPTLTQN